MMDAESALAGRIARERGARRWSLATLAERSGVSRSMLSKIERCEASPTAAVLLTEPAARNARFLAACDQPAWTDPGSGYLRRQVYLSPALPLELVEVSLPAGARVAAPAASYAFIKQVLWVLEETVTIFENGAPTVLRAGDRLQFGPPSDVVFENSGDKPCRYLVAVLRG